MKIAQSCLSLCNPMDCNLPGSSFHGILQARILEWVAIPGDISDPGDLPNPRIESVSPVGTTRRGTATPVHRPQRPAGSTHSSTRGLRPPPFICWPTFRSFPCLGYCNDNILTALNPLRYAWLQRNLVSLHTLTVGTLSSLTLKCQYGRCTSFQMGENE